MTTALPLLLDLVAIAVLTFGLYAPRHRRRELVVALLGVNVGVLAVCVTLASTTVGAGLGLGLFGVLSIIRLRSTELGQHEVAYYFSALALGLLGGLAGTSLWLTGSLMALVLAVIAVGDHPRMLARYRTQLMNVDVAFTDHTALVAHLEGLLGARVHSATVQRLDLVLETTLVEVRYEVPALGSRAGDHSDARHSAPRDADPRGAGHDVALAAGAGR
jgi:hypothetical protein